MHLSIPGWKDCRLDYLLLDLNGTLTCDGEVLPGVATRLARLAGRLSICLITADTLGCADRIARTLDLELLRIEPGDEGRQKAAAVERLGAGQVVAIGNGANDAAMLRAAALGIAVLGPEGLARDALLAADVIVPRIQEGLDLLLAPQRLIATLRQ
jgi:P-type E1-E2 ATPase